MKKYLKFLIVSLVALLIFIPYLRAEETINSINIIGIESPVEGNTPNTSTISITTPGIDVSEANWYEDRENWIESEPVSSFIPKNKYILVISLRFDEGYVLSDDFDENHIDANNEFLKGEFNVDRLDLRLYYEALNEPKVLTSPTVKVKNADNNTLLVTWTSVDNAKEYIVYSSKDNKKWNKKTTTTDLSYVATGLTYGKKYYYKVKAINNTSNKTSKSVSGKTLPNKVENFKVTSVGTNSVKTSWDKVKVDGYELYRSNDNKKWKKITTITKNSSLTNNNKKLKANTVYYYKIRAYKKVGKEKVYGPYSGVIKIRTAPAKPTISLSSTYNSIKANIKKVSGASKYQIYRSLEKSGNYELLTEVTTTSYTDSNLITGQQYYYKVKACNADNKCSGYSSIVNKKPSLKAPTLTLKSYYKEQVTITSGTVPGEDGYVIEYSTNSKKDFKKVVDLDVNTTKYVHESTKLKSKKVFYYRVKAYRFVDGKKVYGSYSKVQKVIINTKILERLKSIKLNVDNKIAIGTTKNVVVTYNPTNKVEDIVWTTSDETVAQVANGKITGVNVGNATITATTTSGITNNVSIIVYKPAETFEISDNNITMYIGDVQTLTATLYPDDITFKDIYFKSLNSSVASVDNDGLITAKSEGTTKIVVSTDEGISRECTIIVKEKPLIFNGFGDSVISNINIPKGNYTATITFDSDSYNSVKLYYGDDEYDYDLLAGEIDDYSGTTLIEETREHGINNGSLVVNCEGAWTVRIEKLVGTSTFPLNGFGSVVTGLFDGIGHDEMYEISFDSDSHNSVKIYEYNGGYFDYDLLVNESEPYHGKVMAKTEKGKKYFFVITSDGSWSIQRKSIPSSVSFPISGTGDYVTGLFDGTGKREVLNVTFDSTDSYNSLKIYKYNGDYFDYDLLVSETDPYNGQVQITTTKGFKYYFVVSTNGTWMITK